MKRNWIEYTEYFAICKSDRNLYITFKRRADKSYEIVGYGKSTMRQRFACSFNGQIFESASLTKADIAECETFEKTLNVYKKDLTKEI